MKRSPSFVLEILVIGVLLAALVLWSFDIRSFRTVIGR